MKAMISGAALLALAVARAASAACEMPSLVAAIPDGATATEQQLLAVQAEVKSYVTAMDGYIACQNQELAAQGENATAEFLYLMSTRIESARKEVDAVATRFNDQVNAFRTARPGASFPPR
jgi:phage host-nuclease inhibitor protein Gam